MIARVPVPEKLIQLAGEHGGVVGVGQAQDHGVSRHVVARLVASGAWRRLAQGVYALSPDSWQQRAWAGLLIGGDQAVLGLAAAAKVWQLPWEPPRRSLVDPPIEIFVGQAHRAPAADGPWRFIRADRGGQSSPARTSVAQTIVDLAEFASADQLAHLVSHGLSHRLTSAAELTAALARTGRHRQRDLLTAIVRDAAEGAANALEDHFVRGVERPHGLPQARRQSRPAGGVDNLYEGYDVIAELDSQADRHRPPPDAADAAQHHGFLTLRYSWADVADHPCATAAAIAAALGQRRWRGVLMPCARCRGVLG
jgi:hypothetical protein